MEKKKVVKRFYAGVVKLAHTDHASLTQEQATKMWRRILNSFASHPDGNELADGFISVINYFSGIGYWRGYKNAKKHYAALNAVRRTPHGRENVHLTIEEMLEKDLEISAERICEQLDEMGLSAWFDLKIRGKQKTILVGPKQKFCWKSVRREDSLKKMISRLRTRVKSERRAEAWMKLADRAFSSEQVLRKAQTPTTDK